jgi:hypothetical protein
VRKQLVTALLTLAFVLLTAGAPAAGQTATGSGELALGAGTTASKQFVFAAYQHHDEPDPVGYAVFRFELTTVRGHVTCLRAVANRASVGIVVEKSNVPAYEGSAFFFAVEDNGRPEQGVSPDFVANYNVPLPVDPRLCPEPLALGALLLPGTALASGDGVVRGGCASRRPDVTGSRVSTDGQWIARESWPDGLTAGHGVAPPRDRKPT